jgi:hypothetical protein
MPQQSFLACKKRSKIISLGFQKIAQMKELPRQRSMQLSVKGSWLDWVYFNNFVDFMNRGHIHPRIACYNWFSANMSGSRKVIFIRKQKNLKDGADETFWDNDPAEGQTESAAQSPKG